MVRVRVGPACVLQGALTGRTGCEWRSRHATLRAMTQVETGFLPARWEEAYWQASLWDGSRDASMPACGPSGQAVGLRAVDGYPLGARVFMPPQHAGEGIRAQLIVAGATGVPQGFYRRFAAHAARRGYLTLTLDPRGIGASLGPGPRHITASLLDWARLDLQAALHAWTHPQRPLAWVGHSLGGHALVMMQDVGAVRRAWGLGVGAGWHGWMPLPERWRVWALWRLAAPVVTAIAGYLPWSRLGMGEDLPLDVYRQWRRWCSLPRYFFDDPLMASELVAAADLRVPAVMANALDDLWALPRSRDAFMGALPHMPWWPRDIDPRAYHLPHIGHMGYFRPSAQRLWDELLDDLDQHLTL